MTRQNIRIVSAACASFVPRGSRIESRVAGSCFHDAWAVVLGADAGRSAVVPVLELVLGALRRTPGWIDACMVLRNRAVRPLGLKDLGRLSDLPSGKNVDEYRPGDRVGIFTLLEHAHDEVLLGDSDRHLDVVVSLHRHRLASDDTARLTLSTVVHVKNRLGSLYMLPVRPMHGLIARTMTAALARPAVEAGH